ncbi:hypothetical protein [Paenibacillus mendelii]|uniref:Uncharacterized protein n=1 Tax=Paenibacillus mendelii TaxID=206163 RepID=A0ABV6JI71_9BACL|nr:hypothetical protein [Paenibacillus mendelii]MCQ6558490.1 hypothetical protein [Paenibacillus mendelii]
MNDDQASVDIPVLTLEEYKELSAIRSEAVGKLISLTVPPLSIRLKDAKQAVPKHLTRFLSKSSKWKQ